MKKLLPQRLVLALVGLLLQGSDANGATSPRRARHLRRHHHVASLASQGGSRRVHEEEDNAVSSNPNAPLNDMVKEADEVARFLEKRMAIAMVPEGANPNIDVTPEERKELEAAFAETPDVFKGCLLIRDFASPLRVGSAVVATHRTLRVGRAQPSLIQMKSRKKLAGGKEDAEEDDTEEDNDDSTDDDDESDSDSDDAPNTKDSDPDDGPPPTELVAKGGVMQRDEAPDNKTDNVLMNFNMIANLESVVGEVAVIPNGMIAKWGSKRKVPIAGYLCTHSGTPVLHTLPTPCLPTALTDLGVPMQPPTTQTPTEAPPPKATAAPAASPSPASFAEESEDSGPPPEGLAPVPAPPTSPPTTAPPTKPPRGNFAVYVGGAKLYFSSQNRAEHFCYRLAKEIAKDPGDNEWDTARLKKRIEQETDISLASFVQMVRKDKPISWTTGTKKVLVVVMDWAPGDSSKAPLSSQTLTPKHYETKIFPRVRTAFQTMSYGKFDISVTVVPEVIQYMKPRSRYSAGGYPFPALYNGATESLAGNARYGNQYKVEDYDLVYTISPQQDPVGTKGVAWVGAKGAMCNGCEAISENFQVMVAVHELGHNLGLAHAASRSLEYGNPYDWMGNYPDVQGLTYGAGYKAKLFWLPRENVALVDDSGLGGLNDKFILKPFDRDGPKAGEIFAIQISLKKNPRDIFIGYEITTGSEAGVYLTLLDKQKPASELLDMGCHSPSQQDARLQPTWTYVDPSSQVVVVLDSISTDSAVVHIYQAPAATALAAIRARPTFSDGIYKCPRTCTDSDLLVASFNGCPALAQQGYCASGRITMGGNKYAVGTDLCPKACNQCAAVLAGSAVVSMGSAGGCDDRTVKINGMDCAGVAKKGLCEATTNIGNVGRDLCPKSCGNCPSLPTFSSNAGTYADPAAVRTRGAGGADGIGPIATSNDVLDDPPVAPAPPPPPPPDSVPPSLQEKGCFDSTTWADKDGDGCSVYKEYIASKRLTQAAACNYDNGAARKNCLKTCNNCPKSNSMKIQDMCIDQPCVREWQFQTGQCFACSDWPSRCNEPAMQKDCPATCGICTPPDDDRPTAPPVTEASAAAAAACKDEPCVLNWKESSGECLRCEDFADSYCGVDPDFMKSCPKSCKLCSTDDRAPVCRDDFKESNCKEYLQWGWCKHDDVSEHCKQTCGICDEVTHDKEKDDSAANTTKVPPTQKSGAGAAAPLVSLLAALLAAASCLFGVAP